MTDGYAEKSVELTEEELKKINAYARTNLDSESIYAFNVTLCNNDIDRDNEKFSVEALYELAELFVGKTGIMDHSMKASDQNARIYDTWVEKVNGRKTADGEDLYCLKAKAYMVKNEYNFALITDIEAGIKKEVSVSCSMGKSICSICGADRTAHRCEHTPGRSYNGNKAYAVLSDALDAYEFSFVAVPAQREAGVTKSYQQSKGVDCMEDITKILRNCDTEVILTKSQADSTADYIESLEDDAKLGREYKKELADELVKLCAVAVPNMDMEIFGNITRIMTAKELKAFKNAFAASAPSKTASLQIKNNDKEKDQTDEFGSLNQFKIY